MHDFVKEAVNVTQIFRIWAWNYCGFVAVISILPLVISDLRICTVVVFISGTPVAFLRL